MEDITPENSEVSIYLAPSTEEEETLLKKQSEEFNAELSSKNKVKESALKKLAKLGLTEEEAKAIVGL